METLKDVFDNHFSSAQFDGKLAKEIYQFQIGYVNANREHMEFFGGNLLGVQVIRFKDRDVDKFFNDVLDVNYDNLLTDIRKLDTINHEFKISGDILNLTLFYVIHRFLTQGNMNDTQRHRAAYDTALIFFYRSAAAVLSAYFKYPADPKIAQATYARLSNKFLIKRLGSWHKVMDYRAEELLNPAESIHFKNMIKFNDDTAIVYMINDSQSRIKDLIKNYYAEFVRVHSAGENIAVTSSTFIDIEGEETVKEKTKSADSYVLYMKQAISDERTFVKDELISVIVDINRNTSFRMVRSTLLWLYEVQNDQKYHKLIDEFISAVVVQSLFYIEHGMVARNKRDYPYILNSLKFLYLSTRNQDPQLEYIRDTGYKLVQSFNPKNSEGLILSTRTSLILYISLRALVGQSST